MGSTSWHPAPGIARPAPLGLWRGCWGFRGWCGRAGGCQRGAGTDSAPKTAERKEEAAKISRWVDREEMIARLIRNGLGKGDKNQKVPRKRELIPLGSRGRSRHRRGSCAPGRVGVQPRDGQNASAAWEVPARSEGSPVPHPAGRGTLSILGGWVGTPGVKWRRRAAQSSVRFVCRQLPPPFQAWPCRVMEGDRDQTECPAL